MEIISVTAKRLAEITDGTLARGDGKLEFTGVNSLDQAKGEDVSFLGNDRYKRQLSTTKAGLVLLKEQEIKELEIPKKTALISVANPSFAFSQVTMFFQKGKKSAPKYGVHPTAYVEPSAKIDLAKVSCGPSSYVGAGAVIGAGTILEPGVYVGPNAIIGEDCHLAANSVVADSCILGNRVILSPGAVVGADGYGYEFVDGKHQKIPQVGIVQIDDDVEIGANTIVDRARFGKTTIGKGTKIDNLVQIAHNVEIGQHCLIAGQVGISGSTKIGNGVIMGGRCGLAGHIEIGDHAILAGGARTRKSLAGGQTYMGDPAQPIKDEQRLRASIRRLPKILQKLKNPQSISETQE